jgi:hypothetical protein
MDSCATVSCPTVKCAVEAVGKETAALPPMATGVAGDHGPCLQLRLQNMKPQTVEPGNVVSVERAVGRQKGRLLPVPANSAVHKLIAVRVFRPGRFCHDAHGFGQVR